MKRILLILITFVFGACVNTSEKLSEKKVLEEITDEQGRIKRKVSTGYIPGEDTYLTINEFDSMGNVTREFGALPYGRKFKTEYKYDKQNRLTHKIEYDFGFEEFENYKGGEYELYSLKDTVADFDTKRIRKELRIRYDDKSNTLYKRILRPAIDSTTGREIVDSFDSVEPIKK